MATFNGRDWTVADMVPFKYVENWDPFFDDVIAEMDARRNDLGASLVATSSTNDVAIGTGPKTLTVASPSAKGFAAGMYVVAVDASNSANAMTGRVTSYDAGTGALVISVPTGGTAGSGTPSSWVIGISGAVGPAGADGANGATGPLTTYWGGTAGGTVNALTATTGASLSGLTRGQIIGVRMMASPNSGSTTLAVDGAPAIIIRKNGSLLVGGELAANTDVWLQYDGTVLRLLSSGGSGLFSGVSSKSADYTVVSTDNKYLIECTTSLTLSLTAAATLGNGFTFAVWNSGTGTVIIDPSGSETINDATTLTLQAGQWALITCTGTAWKAPTQPGQSSSAWSPTDKEAALVISASGLTASVASGGAMQSGRGTKALSGKRYFEIILDVKAASGPSAFVGIATLAATFSSDYGIGESAGGYAYADDTGRLLHTRTETVFGATWNAAGVVIGVAYDDVSTPGSVKLWFARNGVWQGGGDPTTGASPAFTISSATFYPAITCKNGGQITARFSAAFWTYAAPSGFSQIP